MMSELPKILGNADPMHYAQLLPGVQTCSEYDSGLRIQGCDDSHNMIAISGVPVYNVSHLMGFFSIFNSSHYKEMNFEKNAYSSVFENRLGGYINMEITNSIPQKTGGEFSIGPLSSQGTIKLRFNEKSALIVSARAAYLNFLYGGWLKMDENDIKYDFSDYNFSYIYKPNKENRILIDFYSGSDNAKLNDRIYQTDLKSKWGNMLAGLHWDYKSDMFSMKHKIYYTSYENNFDLKFENMKFQLPSSIYDYGYSGVFRIGYFSFGGEVIMHNISPQYPQKESFLKDDFYESLEQVSEEYSCFVNYEKIFIDYLKFNIGVRGTYYKIDDESFKSYDPVLSLGYENENLGYLKLQYSTKHQYLFKSGFKNMGFPAEFWHSSTRDYKPQHSDSYSLSYDHKLFSGRYGLSIELYYKKLYNQLEYKGDLLDMFYTEYNLDTYLLKGKGENYGINIMLNKRIGKLTGWLSYSCGRAFRRFNHPDYKKKYPANHERIHELSGVVGYKFSEKWDATITSVIASGTPFTAPAHFYMINNSMIAEYGEHNANRLRPYFRSDISVNYTFINKENLNCGFNLSLYNFSSFSNDINYRMKIYNDSFAYKPLRFTLKVLPSLNFYCLF